MESRKTTKRHVFETSALCPSIILVKLTVGYIVLLQFDPVREIRLTFGQMGLVAAQDTMSD